jgi:hypothetical protein
MLRSTGKIILTLAAFHHALGANITSTNLFGMLALDLTHTHWVVLRAG